MWISNLWMKKNRNEDLSLRQIILKITIDCLQLNTFLPTSQFWKRWFLKLIWLLGNFIYCNVCTFCFSNQIVNKKKLPSTGRNQGFFGVLPPNQVSYAAFEPRPWGNTNREFRFCTEYSLTISLARSPEDTI